jgi:hypothetical protein
MVQSKRYVCTDVDSRWLADNKRVSNKPELNNKVDEKKGRGGTRTPINEILF